MDLFGDGEEGGVAVGAVAGEDGDGSGLDFCRRFWGFLVLQGDGVEIVIAAAGEEDGSGEQ